MRCTRWLVLLSLSLEALAHPSGAPHFWCDYTVGDDGVTLALEIRRVILAKWTGLDLGPDRPTSPDAERELFAAIESFFRLRNTLQVNGEHVAPRVLSVAPVDDPTKKEYLLVKLGYTAGVRPRRVTVLWEDFDDAEYEGNKVVPMRFLAGPAADVVVLPPEDPEFTWHRPVDPPAPAVIEPAGGGVPLLSLAAAAGGLLLAFLLRRRPLVAVAVLLLGGGGAALAWPRAPAPTEAERIFLALHRNVYRAFEARTEEGIYDRLKKCVEGPLLERLYLDIHESRLLRDRGGAVAQIEEVEEEGGEIRNGSANRFEVTWRWRVHCSVTHFGHTHGRINAYAADYVVRRAGGAWRIADVTVNESERTELDGGDR